jgi:hypothetical protein
VSAARIVLGGGFLAAYLDGGGHWSAFLQYLLGLRALGHDAFWLEVLDASGDPAVDRARIDGFLTRMRDHGFEGRSAILLHDAPSGAHDLARAACAGVERPQLAEIVRGADLLWNFSASIKPPLVREFRRPVLVDLDPGHLHVSALEWDLGIANHDACLTVGTKLHDPDCEVPVLGARWRAFLPPIHLPSWPAVPDPGPGAPFASITQWTSEELWLGARVLSVSKRDAYLRYATLPERAGRPFELAANIHPDDPCGDRERLAHHGWRLVDPHRVARTPEDYRCYVQRARGEVACPKPIHAALRTGWFSDRSAAFLATGRPVAFEDTGIGERVPSGAGLVLFKTPDEAVDAVAAIDGNYAHHARAARALAEAHLDSARVLPAMIDASFTN